MITVEDRIAEDFGSDTLKALQAWKRVTVWTEAVKDKRAVDRVRHYVGGWAHVRIEHGFLVVEPWAETP